MSISNIFECCKKTEILMGISGIILGTYATNAFLHSPIIGIPVDTIEVINLPPTDGTPTDILKKTVKPIVVPEPITDYISPIDMPEPIDIPESINDPVPPINIPLSPPISYFEAFMNSNVIAIEDGLALLTISNGMVVAISALTFYTLKVLLNRIFRRMNMVNNYAQQLGENSFISRNLKSHLNVEKYKNLSDTQIPPSIKPKPISRKDLSKFRYKPADDFKNKRKKEVIEDSKDKPSFFIVPGGKMGNTIYFFEDVMESEKIKNLRNIIQSILPEVKSEVIIENKQNEINEKDEVDEKEEVNESIRKIEEDKKILDEIINNTEVYVNLELYNEFMKIIMEFSETHGQQIPVKPIEEIFNSYNIPYQSDRSNNFNMNVNFEISENINVFDRLYHVAYNDLQNFLSYGNKILEGDVTVTMEGNNIKVNPNTLKIRDLNEEGSLIRISFKKYSYPQRTMYFYKRFILPLLAVLRKEGISKYSIKLETMFVNVINPENAIEYIKDPKLLIAKIPSTKYRDKYELEIIKTDEGKITKIENFEEHIKEINKLSKETIRILEEKYDFNYNEDKTPLENLKRIYNYKRELDIIDQLFYDIYLKEKCIQALMKIIKNIYLKYHNR